MAARKHPQVTLSDMIRRDIDVLQRRRAAPLAVAALAALLTVLAGCSAPGKPQASAGRLATRSVTPASSQAASLQRATPTVSPTPTPTPRPRHAEPSALPVAPPDAGSKPQTTVQPKTSSVAFKNAVHDIWL